MDLSEYREVKYVVITADDWKDALQVQWASNLAGVTRSFADMILKIRTEATHQGRDWYWVDRHPILRLFAYKINALVGQEDVSFGVSDEYRELESLAAYFAKPEKA